MNIWVVMVIGGLLTFLTRLSFIALLDRIKVPDWFRRGLRFVPVAVLSAIILPELTSPNGTYCSPGAIPSSWREGWRSWWPGGRRMSS